jgi:RNA polymerase sigma-70 factor (ECF subfamily)
MLSTEQFLRTHAGRWDFASTHWSVVLLAGSPQSPQAAEALEKLACAYWYPLYSFVRRQGHSPDGAADLTQDFFVHLLATDALAWVNPSRGNFRSFLLASLKNLLANEWHRERRQKRGGGASVLSLDVEMAEGRFQLEAADSLPPDKAFDRRWAEIILARALDRLRVECDGEHKTRRFDALKTFLLGEKGTLSLSETAEVLNMSLPAIKGLVHRLRRRFRELIRDEIAQTVASREEIDREIQDLFAVLRD